MKPVSVVLIILGVAAAMAATAAVASLPRAVANMAREPEDVYLLIFWAVVTGGLSLFWFGAAAHLATGFLPSLVKPLRIVAQAVAGVGVLCGILAVFAQSDELVAVLFSCACVFSGIAVHRALGQRGESVNDA